jgi:5-methylcytosine-specific restriction endonuclease McrA/endogenous inhibitor of DNA gyrase (YacG/DUF329 family)
VTAHRPYTGSCFECGISVGAARRIFCSNKCRDREKSRRFREKNGLSKHAAWYQSLPSDLREEYRRRSREAAARRGYKQSKESRIASDQSRRARKLGAYVETVRFSDVARRDRWTCYICSERIDKTLAFPDPLSASLDHVVPLSVGGTHEPSNVRITHLRCNVSKGNRPVEQPAQMVMAFGHAATLRAVPRKPPPEMRTFECPVCGASVSVRATTKNARRYCSRDCGRVANAILNREKYQPKIGRHKQHLYQWAGRVEEAS